MQPMHLHVAPPLDGNAFGEDQLCFACGPHHPHGFRLRFEAREGMWDAVNDETSQWVESAFTPRELDQGAPGVMHGGLVTTIADEVGVWALVVLLGKFGFTTEMHCKFPNPIRVGIPAVARARVLQDSTRIMRVEVQIHQTLEDCTRLCFNGQFHFIWMDEKMAERTLGKPLREEWKRFCKTPRASPQP
jgi:acyl-coenzyme A thioesterase PaaI-like protein